MATVSSSSAYAVRLFFPICIRLFRVTLSDKLRMGRGTLALQTDIIAVQRKYYGQDWSLLYQWLLVMSTQLIGFSMGGVARRLLVSPPSMSASTVSLERPSLRTNMMGALIPPVWPVNLVTCALFNTLHSQVYSGFYDKGMSRERFFLYGFLGSCIWCMYPRCFPRLCG